MAYGVEIALVAAVIGAGISAYGQYQSSQTQSVIADFNAKQQEANARTQMLSLQAQAALKEREAQTNFKLRAAESQARFANARNMERQAKINDELARANLQKRRLDFARMQSTQRAAIAEAGVVESSGTPLDLLAETAALIQQDQEEKHYENELARRNLFTEAAFERLGGKFALAGATLDRRSSLAESDLVRAGAAGAYSSGIREAQISRLTGDSVARAGYYTAGATLLSGVSGAAGGYTRYRTS